MKNIIQAIALVSVFFMNDYVNSRVSAGGWDLEVDGQPLLRRGWIKCKNPDDESAYGSGRRSVWACNEYRQDASILSKVTYSLPDLQDAFTFTFPEEEGHSEIKVHFPTAINSWSTGGSMSSGAYTFTWKGSDV